MVFYLAHMDLDGLYLGDEVGDLVGLSVRSRVGALSVGDEEDDGIGLGVYVGYGVGALVILFVGDEEDGRLELYVGYGCW